LKNGSSIVSLRQYNGGVMKFKSVLLDASENLEWSS